MVVDVRMPSSSTTTGLGSAGDYVSGPLLCVAGECHRATEEEYQSVRMQWVSQDGVSTGEGGNVARYLGRHARDVGEEGGRLSTNTALANASCKQTGDGGRTINIAYDGTTRLRRGC